MIPELLFADGDLVRLKTTSRLRAILERQNVFFARGDNWPQEIVLPKSARIKPYTSFFTGVACSMGVLSYTEALVPPVYRVQIGRYCSIAMGVSFMGERHPIERVTSSSFTYRPLRGPGHPAMAAAARDFGPYRGTPNTFDSGVTVIGHDV